ncbi:MAG TPA: hypothetical protein DCG34_06020 [Clostridiales bacterium]|nr:hypothetical protein [Clostridiales bacterium]
MNINKKLKSGFWITVITMAILLTIVLGRLVWAHYQVSKYEIISESFVVTELGSVESLNILPLFEEWTSSNELQSGHGVSYLIKTDQSNILMDLGNNEQNLDTAPLLHNMKQLGIEMDEIDKVVISHNHPDHVGGVTNWKRGNISVGRHHDNLDGKKVYLPVKLTSPSIEIELALEPMVIAPGVATLGRQPFVQPFPFWLWEPLGWELSLVVNVEEKGLVIITGCGHPTMERIIERAEAIFPQSVIGVVGGMHYENADEEALKQHINFLELRNPELVALSPHDSSGSVLQVFEAAFPKVYRYITVGRAIEIP